MEKLINHFKFRFVQVFRIFNLNPKVSIPALLVFVALIAVKLPKHSYYPIIFCVIIALFHAERKDIPFLKKVFVQNWRWIILLEVTIIYTVLLLVNIHYKIERIGLISYLLITSLIFIPSRTKPWLSLEWNIVPNSLFEWKSFLRKNSWKAILGFIIVLFSSYQPAVLIFIGAFVLDFISHIYQPHESKEMLEMYFKKYTLKEKIRKNTLFFNMLLLPTCFSFLILNPYQSLYILYYFAFMNLYLLLMLVRKYKNYNHKNKDSDYNMGIYFEYFLCSMTIIPALFILKSGIKEANQNIKTYVGN
ncbi:hypothetical protein H5J24_12250 [Chryseobacterium capnotolerans]|uniref:hypothetical protein n=1 Tax=Chryseobacterium TaxID=59732 RepID=UPI00083B93D3|nr:MULTISPECIES: hypothetical protein [Chryseobacterium]UHO40653.1 hypothetical protein H5J24_12250 [Chryseobacterium capnotolerans]